MQPSTNSHGDMSENLNTVTMAEWLVRYLGTHYSEAFIKAANGLGFPTKGMKIDKVTATAMWEEANLSVTSQ